MQKARVETQRMAFDNFVKKNDGLLAAAYQTMATIEKAAKGIPFMNDFAVASSYQVQGDGSVAQNENHFDNVFKSIAMDNRTTTSEFNEEEMPQPKEGKDIELGWDIAHMTEEDFKELKLRAQKLFEKDKRPVILFDGICNFCNAYVNTVIDLDTNA